MEKVGQFHKFQEARFSDNSALDVWGKSGRHQDDPQLIRQLGGQQHLPRGQQERGRVRFGERRDYGDGHSAADLVALICWRPPPLQDPDGRPRIPRA